MEAHKVLKHPSGTEKSIRMMDSENKLVFIVDRKATKADIKKALEEMYEAKVLRVTTMITMQGTKKAIVRFKDDYPAIDLATKLGMI
jgi:large subunit ribosomal protein L23